MFEQISNAQELPDRIKEQYLDNKPTFDYPLERWEQIIKKRDKEFLRRLR